MNLYLSLVGAFLELGVDLVRIALGRSQRLDHRPWWASPIPSAKGVEIYVYRYTDAMGKEHKRYYHFKEDKRG